MNNRISIKEKKEVTLEPKVVDFLNPDYLYIPITREDTIKVKTNSEVYKEQLIVKSERGDVYSPVSGKVIGKTSSMLVNNQKMDCIVIENDFREKTKKRQSATKYIHEFEKEEMLELLSKYNTSGKVINSRGKTLLVSGIDADPYEHTYSYLINAHSDKLLETIDALATILEVETTILAINNNDTHNVISLTNNIGTYPNITLKMLPNVYPMGFKEILIKNILNRKQISKGYTYLSVQDVYNIYNVLKRKKSMTEKLVTISGNAIENPLVVNAKIGSSMADIIKNCCEVINRKYFVVVNGLVAGRTLKSLNSVLTSDIRSIFLSVKDESVEKKCINCGLCNSKCPVGLNPKYLKEHKKADRSKCIHCGLCTYICPSKINFKDCLGGNEDE